MKMCIAQRIDTPKPFDPRTDGATTPTPQQETIPAPASEDEEAITIRWPNGWRKQ